MLLRALRTGHGDRALRVLSANLAPRRETPAALDPGRLADRRMAFFARSGRQRRAREESAVGPFALEDIRQPASQPGSCRTVGALAARLVRACATALLDLPRTGNPAAADDDRHRVIAHAQIARCGSRPSPHAVAARFAPSSGTAVVRSGMPAPRSVFEPHRDHT